MCGNAHYGQVVVVVVAYKRASRDGAVQAALLGQHKAQDAGFRYGECSCLRDHTLPRYWCGAVCGVVQGRSRGDVHL